jgi:hypothetical protein
VTVYGAGHPVRSGGEIDTRDSDRGRRPVDARGTAQPPALTLRLLQPELEDGVGDDEPEERPAPDRGPDRYPQPPAPIAAIRDGKRTFEEAGGARAYFGWPAEATAEEGRATIGTLGAILVDAVDQALKPESGS